MTALPFGPAALGDLSPLLGLGVAEAHAPEINPGREDEGYDLPVPDTDDHFSTGRPLGRTLDPAHNRAVWSKP